MQGFLINTVNDLKVIQSSFLTQGLALIVLEKYAWYVYDINATELVNNDTVISANNGSGKWIKCNNTTNLNNSINAVTISTSNTIINQSLYDSYYLDLQANTSITFSNLISGLSKLIIKYNSFTISNWDSRVKWQSSVFIPSVTKELAILEFITYNADIYCTNISEY